MSLYTRYDKSSNVLTADTNVGQTPALWKEFPFDAVRLDSKLGVFEHHRAAAFPGHSSTSGGAVSGVVGPYTGYLYQGGAIANTTSGTQGGEAVFSSDGDNEGAAICTTIPAFFLSTAKRKLIFEARIRSSTITDTKHGLFCGLLEGGAVAAGVPLATDGTLADKNFIGFHRLEGDGDMLDLVYKADGQTQQTLLADAITLEAATWIKVGFVYDSTKPAAQKIKFFYNGLPLSTYATQAQMEAATFPSDIALGFCFAVMNATGSTPGNSSFSDAWIGQLY